MNMLHLSQTDYTVSRWSGGTTTQIAISPPDASYSARDFLWRISSAVVEDEQSVFPPLPDYDRQLMLLDGSLLLRHDDGEPLRLDAFQVHAFDGGAATESQGRCRDFNLMLRKGRCRGRLRPLRLEGPILLPPPQGGLLLLYCAAGQGALGKGTVLARGESILLEDGEAPLGLSVSAPADFVAAEIWCEIP